MLTSIEVYQLYRQFVTENHATYIGNYITGKVDTNIPPEQEQGITLYNFHGSSLLASFINFVIREQKLGPEEIDHVC